MPATTTENEEPATLEPARIKQDGPDLKFLMGLAIALVVFYAGFLVVGLTYQP